MMHEFTIGDRVVLKQSKYHSSSCKDLPVWGSRHSCVGTVKHAEAHCLEIGWDNGRKGVFSKGFILPHNASLLRDPNMLFLIKKNKGINKEGS